MSHELVERIWYGTDIGARAARLALWPAARAFAGVTRARNALYDAGVLASATPALPAISIGNLTVGGTGKTPIAAEVARRLRMLGARPAIVLRGYGADEPLVHERLNPGLTVVVAADRVAGVAEARARGATVAVLDDAFQHRRARRRSDVVLISADRWDDAPPRQLPAGPWREPLSALARATLAVITRKAASDDAVAHARVAVHAAGAGLPVVVARLAPGALVRATAPGATADQLPLSALDGRRVAVIAAIGDPAALLRQLEREGARTMPYVYPDHHAFTAAEITALASRVATAELVVCTLKDAVKLAPAWPRAALPLWYVSQSVTFEQGEDELDRVLGDLLPLRPPHP